MPSDAQLHHSGAFPLSVDNPQTGPMELTPLPRSFSWLTFIIGILVGATLLGSVWGLVTIAGSSPPPTGAAAFTLRGKMTLTDGVFGTSPCRGSGGYSDIGAGTSVTVYGASGTVIGTGHLEAGQNTSAGDCQFAVLVERVPAGEKFYQVEVSHRGKITVAVDDARAGLLAISLGR